MTLPTWAELSFLAPPDQIADWRKVLLYEAAASTDLLAALPATAAAAAQQLGLDPRAVRVLLDALAAWDIVIVGGDGVVALGPGAPEPAAGAVLRHHARALHRWASALQDRLRGIPPEASPGPDPAAVKIMLDGLVMNARESAPAVVQACLERVPEARTVLDLGGGHGEHALEFARCGRQVTLQDRPAVLDLGPREVWSAAGVTTFGGDFFETLPDATFDLVFCAGVTHTYDAAANLALFRRVRQVLAPGGVLAVMTLLGGTDARASIFAVQMLTVGGGDSHREDDYRRWLAETGYGRFESGELDGRPQRLLWAWA